jgi:hypothetical protein
MILSWIQSEDWNITACVMGERIDVYKMGRKQYLTIPLQTLRFTSVHVGRMKVVFSYSIHGLGSESWQGW